MTARKGDLARELPPRTPAYVDRELGSAELRISPETWDAWVDSGILPKPAPGFPETAPRWRWVDVDRKLSGQGVEAAAAGNGIDPSVAAAGRVLNGSQKGRRRVAA